MEKMDLDTLMEDPWFGYLSTVLQVADGKTVEVHAEEGTMDSCVIIIKDENGKEIHSFVIDLENSKMIVSRGDRVLSVSDC